MLQDVSKTVKCERCKRPLRAVKSKRRRMGVTCILAMIDAMPKSWSRSEIKVMLQRRMAS